MFPPGLEPGTFRVLGECDNRYTTETADYTIAIEISEYNIDNYYQSPFDWISWKVPNSQVNYISVGFTLALFLVNVNYYLFHGNNRKIFERNIPTEVSAIGQAVSVV